MEQTLNKLLNLGIGSVKTIEKQVQSLREQAEAKVQELITIGENATDEGSSKVKSLIEKATSQLKEIEEKVLAITDQAKAKIEQINPAKKEKVAEKTEAA